MAIIELKNLKGGLSKSVVAANIAGTRPPKSAPLDAIPQSRHSASAFIKEAMEAHRPNSRDTTGKAAGSDNMKIFLILINLLALLVWIPRRIGAKLAKRIERKKLEKLNARLNERILE
jgi:hypothetical protein